jgi:hypothetical protein
MTWQMFLAWLDTFLWGFAFGFFGYPLWQVLKKIWQEARLAKQEWKQPK